MLRGGSASSSRPSVLRVSALSLPVLPILSTARALDSLCPLGRVRV